MPELHRPRVTQEAVSLMICAVLTGVRVRGVRLMMVTIMRHCMMGNMGSIVAMGVVVARVLEVISPLGRLPGVQQAGGGGRGALEREYRERHLVTLGRVQGGLLGVGGLTGR